MGRRRRSSVARASALAVSMIAAIMLAIDLAHPAPRLNVVTICIWVVTAALWPTWGFIRTRELSDQVIQKDRRVRAQHAEQRLRGLLSKADSDR